VFDKKMRGPDLARLPILGGKGSAMIRRHVDLEFLRVGPRRGLPSRILPGRVEVIREVLALAVTNLPAWRKSGLRLLQAASHDTSALSKAGKMREEEGKAAPV
jgi:hypothetical protein